MVVLKSSVGFVSEKGVYVDRKCLFPIWALQSFLLVFPMYSVKWADWCSEHNHIPASLFRLMHFDLSFGLYSTQVYCFSLFLMFVFWGVSEEKSFKLCSNTFSLFIAILLFCTTQRLIVKVEMDWTCIVSIIQLWSVSIKRTVWFAKMIV